MQHVTRHRPGRPRAARSEETRERILRVARDVFSEFGHDAATFQEIAQRADLTRPAINHYFPSKRVLYDAVLAQAGGLVGTAAAAARDEIGLIARVSAYFAALAQVEEKDRSAVAFVMTAVLDAERRPELSPQMGDLKEVSRDFFRWALTEAIDGGELDTDADVESLVEMLTAMLWGVGFYIAFVGDRDGAALVNANLQLLLTNRLWRLDERRPAADPDS